MLPSLHTLSLRRGRTSVPTDAGERPMPEWAQLLATSAELTELQRLRELNDRYAFELEVAKRATSEANNQAQRLQNRLNAIEASGPSLSLEERRLQRAGAERSACLEKNQRLNRNFVRVQNELQTLQSELNRARGLLDDQGALIKEAEKQETFLTTKRVEAQLRLKECKDALAKVLRELSGSYDHESFPDLEEDPDPDPEPDPELDPAPEPDPAANPPNPALDLAPCPDRDRPPGDNPQPPCDRPKPAPEPKSEPPGKTRNPLWQKQMNQQKWVDNLTKDWAYPWTTTPAQKAAYYKDALEKIQHEVKKLSNDMRRSEVPVLLRIAEKQVDYFVTDAFRPPSFWSYEVTKLARFAFFVEEYKPEWADAFNAFAAVCLNVAAGILKIDLPKMHKAKKKYKKPESKSFNRLEVIAQKLFDLMANLKITFFVSNEYPMASDNVKAAMLDVALPIWHRITILQIQARAILREIPRESPLKKDALLIRLNDGLVALGNAMLAFDDAVGGDEKRLLFTLFSEERDDHAWIRDTRKRVHNLFPYKFDSSAYDRQNRHG